jgi:hypothetical protein
MKKTTFITAAAIAAISMLASPSYAASNALVGFDGGTNDGFQGNAYFEATGGNPGGNAHHLAPDFFGTSLRTGALGEPANPSFLGDYSSFDEVTFELELRVDVLRDFIGNPIFREIGIALRDRDIQGPSGASGVFFTLDVIGESLQPDWTNLSVTIDDPTSPTLPAGWIGFGDEDPNTFEPILPAGATFATVLAGVDEFEITTFVPGYFYTSANTDIRIDNIRVTVPEPTCFALLGLGLLTVVRRR